MGKKDKKSKADKKARVAEKQNKKAAQKEKKATKKGPAGDDSDAEDVDLDAVLAQYAEQQAQFLKVTEVVCDPPPARSSATLVGSPSNSNELFLFGGEYYNGALAKFFNDLYVYIIDKDEWRQITSPNSPLPRSGHAWCRGGNTGGIYLFGGEFSSPKQGTFYHYNDFWRLEPSSREWTRIETKGKGPPARSGHRMTYYKNYIILFGGFQDTSQQTKYLNDLWIYDCSTFTWHNPILPQAAQKPDARSSFSFLPHDQGAVVYGGYSRIKLNTTAGRQTKGGGGMAQRSILKPVVHQDTWFLRIIQPGSDAPATAPPTIRWERRKRPANPPNPPRAGVTMAHHKGRGILFGGVYDVEESEEGIDSEFFNALYAWNVERNRFFQLTIRRPRGPAKKQQQAERGGRRGRGKADEEELLRNLAALEAKHSIDDADAVKLNKTPEEDEDDEPAKPQKNVAMELPHPRFNTAMAVQDDVLYLFGGTFEKGDREFTFDELWAVDLGKLDGVTEIFKREVENWEGSEDEESEEEDEDEEESGDESDAGAENVAGEASTRATSLESEDVTAPPKAEKLAEKDKEVDAGASPDDPSNATEDATASSALAQADGLPHPRPFESLRDFFARSSTQWQEVLLAKLDKAGVAPEARTVKEIRKQAFEMAEEKWWDCREEIRALEDEQEEAGIGEVVALEERGSGGGGGGAGRRR